MQYCNDDDICLPFGIEVDRVRKPFWQCPAQIAIDNRKLTWRSLYPEKDCVDLVQKFLAKTGQLEFVPSGGIAQVYMSFFADAEHQAFLKPCNISDRTSAHGLSWAEEES